MGQFIGPHQCKLGSKSIMFSKNKEIKWKNTATKFDIVIWKHFIKKIKNFDSLIYIWRMKNFLRQPNVVESF